MKHYTLTAAQSIGHPHLLPERTASKRATAGLLDFDRHYQVWPSRHEMARVIRAQERRERRSSDWTAVVKLTDIEGY